MCPAGISILALVSLSPNPKSPNAARGDRTSISTHARLLCVIKWLRSRGVWFWSVTITVVSVGGLFVGSQIAHDRGQTVDWYAGFGQWLGALGSIIAAAAALYIATRDRKERARERHAEHAAQARLVRHTFKRATGSQNYVLTILNYGDHAVLNVYITEVLWQAEPEAVWFDTNEFIEVVPPHRDDDSEERFMIVKFVDSQGQTFPELIGHGHESLPIIASTRGAPDVVFHFTDAHGNEWLGGTCIEDPEPAD